jgi:predicted O-methyltransferase YrrM
MMDFDKGLVQAQFSNHSINIEYMLDDVLKIIESCSDIRSFEGNCFYYHLTSNRFPELLHKQMNLFWCGQQVKQRVCEIGFNAGHSAYLMLLGQGGGKIEFTVFDICEHAYAKPCFEYIQKKFPNTSVKFIEGDSTKTLPAWIDLNSSAKGTYDVVHVDGGHSEACITSDLFYARMLVKKGGIIIIDDTNDAVINGKVNELLENKEENYEELPVFPTVGYQHRILRKN